MALVLALPELSCELSGSVFPATTDAHTLVKLGTNLGERALPDVIFFELFFYSGAKCLGRHFKQVLHASLGIGRVDLLVAPDAIETVLSCIH